MMSLDDARTILRAGPQPGAENFVRHATAAAVIYMNDSVKRGYTTDARIGPMLDLPGRTFDQPRYTGPERSREWRTEQSRGVRLDETCANIVTEAPNPGEEVGADLVEALPGDVSSYFIARDPRTGKAALYRYKQPQIDPGTVGRSNGTTTRTMDYYRGIASQMTVLRETTGAVLKGINAANREAWSKRGCCDPDLPPL